ncbi:prepilin-type N-terminal cleavage/methylation domain-containing protein [Neptunomonas japonica]|uniref:MSHA pilin protein MshC n=1 Tax=Neptunomonas japonica JAMM 1380 TaxID=1441457 RepID=A0A7R6PKZ6_9GAMM|nr:prepilin-type N-terminal cleavage/methylation domain-containing protein [Neptunomonas japonica]BBB31508.1 MSHA pilin protein MshC [Neptunomonas japonica JAMM 1380]
MKHSIRQQTGFTLIELVTVLLLLGILSAVAFARLGGVNSFSESLFQQQVLSYLRLAQRTAVAHQGSGAQLNINRVSTSEWDITLVFATQTLSYQLDGDNALTFASGASTGSISTGDTLSLVYSDNGDLSELTAPLAADIDASLSLVVAGNRSLCISPTGFAYEGLCL